MAYKNNWFRYFFAAINGEAWSNSLAKDFWSEDLWDLKNSIRWRWAKMVWVYSASAFVQITLPGLLVPAAISLVKPVPPLWWLMSVGATRNRLNGSEPLNPLLNPLAKLKAATG